MELTFELRRNPTHRHLIQERLRPRATAFLEAVNDTIAQANKAFRSLNPSHASLVVIVDNLDRLLRLPVPNMPGTSHDMLFVQSASLLQELGCHVIYTLPPAILHSPQGPRLQHLYPSSPQMLPMIPVTTRESHMHLDGIGVLMAIVRERLKTVGSDSVFDSEVTMRRLCEASGGYVRHLMTLMRQTLFHSRELPIGPEAVAQAIGDSRDSFIRGMSPAHWAMLQSVARTGEIDESEAALELLQNLSVLEYRDIAGPWYGVNPVLQEARELAG